jgi:DNA-binding transcriptional MerR regulator
MSKNISIGEAARLCGLSPRRLRHLEEYGYMSPGWHDVGGGRKIRVYDEAAISRLQRIADLMKQGFPPRVAAEKAGGAL